MKARMLLAVLILASAAMTTACYSNTFVYPDRQPTRQVEVTRPFYIFGLVSGEKRPVVAHELCGGPVQAVETVHTFGNMCLGAITLQIYTPNTVRVTCASGQAHNFYLDEQDVVVAHEVVDGQTGETVYRSLYTDVL